MILTSSLKLWQKSEIGYIQTRDISTLISPQKYPQKYPQKIFELSEDSFFTSRTFQESFEGFSSILQKTV